MALTDVLIGDEVRVNITLKYIDETGQLVGVDPDEVRLTVKKDNDTIIIDNQLALTSGDDVYFYDFTPNEIGEYLSIFTIYILNSPPFIIQQKIYVSSSSASRRPTATLKNDEIIIFGTELTPLYIDPESLLPLFPDASLLEIGEIVYNFSLEVKTILGLSADDAALNFKATEYIRAAVACELSRTYAYGADDNVMLKLGDLTIENRVTPRNSISRDNASSWCQIAAALRKELLANKVRAATMTPKGLPTEYSVTQLGRDVYPTDKDIYGQGQEVTSRSDPMPSRKLRNYD